MKRKLINQIGRNGRVKNYFPRVSYEILYVKEGVRNMFPRLTAGRKYAKSNKMKWQAK